MTVTAAITVNQIMTRVAVECGLDAETDPYGSQSQHYIQMQYLLQTAGEELCLAFPWEFLRQLFEITVSPGDDGEYELPPDFQSFIDQTGWNKSTEEPLIGPLSPQEWEAITGTRNQNLIRYAFRLFNGHFNIYPDPPDEGMELSIEYQSRYFVESGETPGTYKPSFTSGADIILFDRTLITRYLKTMWLEAKGFDSSAAQNGLNQAFNNLTGKDKGGRVLDAGGRGQGIHYLDGSNTPITGFGQ